MTPADYLQQHKIRDKLYALTRSLAIHQPHNPDAFLSASQHLVERDALLRNLGGNRKLPHEKMTQGVPAANAGASGTVGPGMDLTSLMLELEHNTRSLEGLSSAIVPNNGFVRFDPDGSQAALVGSLRVFLLANAAAEDQAQKALLKLVNAGVPTSRQGYLQTLPEAFPRPALCREEAAKQLALEWTRMCLEYTQHTNKNDAPANYEAAIEQYQEQIDFRVGAGWLYEHAKNYALLSSVFARGTMARALEKKDKRFATSAYALADALNSRVKVQFETGKFESGEDHAGRYYRNLTGYGSLALDYPKWKDLENPDATGFTGLTTCAFLCPSRKTENFDANGWKAQVKHGEFESVDSDIVAFDSREPDDHGFHHGINIGDKQNFAAYPPYTLFRLQTIFEPGHWTAPGPAGLRLRPKCRLLLVSATYRFPDERDDGDQSHKLCENSTTLNYGSRFTFIQGLTDILGQPTLTMEQEWNRSTRWTDRNGNEFWSVSEWKYVNGPAEPADCMATVGQIRDEHNAGKRPEDFMDVVNRDIKNHFRVKKDVATALGLRTHRFTSKWREEFHLLTLDEVLAVRLYTGPGYQPINDFLRQISHLSGHMRRALAKSTALTFAATVGHICHAIRKLAAITPDTKLGESLYRGVRGELPHTFWVKDSQGMVCAVDGGFLSTSKNKKTPISYMCKGLNTLWVIKPKPESDTAYHRGAEVSQLSQFASEEEVLFPPCTMLVVDRDASTHTSRTSGDTSQAHTQTLSICDDDAQTPGGGGGGEM
jgi:hypothetical protein